MKEIWKDVEGYEGLYRVSNHGRVWGCKHNKLLKPIDHHSGYQHLVLSKNSKVKHHNIHRLVALAFVKPIGGKNCVNHIDDDKTNNRADNLEWCTHKENNNHGTFKERMLSTRKVSEKWQMGIRSRSKPVVGTNLKTGKKIYFPSMKSAERNGFSNGSISNCIKGKSKSYKGHKWQLVLPEDKAHNRKVMEGIRNENQN
ncbi:NUMOD4 domain-containing protein [Staphylococcus saprophyticus]|nr:NUMOD4 domain-containing protein [Staphylococcus saprophyticus]